MVKSFKQIPMSELRIKLPKLRRHIQAGNLRVVCTHYGEVMAFLLPLQDIEELNSSSEESKIQRYEEMPLTQFRDQLAKVSDSLVAGVDCIYLTFHNRRVVGFVSPRFTQYLSLPLIGDPNQVLFVPTESQIYS